MSRESNDPGVIDSCAGCGYVYGENVFFSFKFFFTPRHRKD